MKFSSNILFLTALAALVSAAPIERREIKYVTTTVAVVKTDWVMKTVWVNQDGSPASTTPLAFTTTPVGAAPTPSSYVVAVPSISSASVSLDPAISSVSFTPSSAAVSLDPSVTQPPAQINAPAPPAPAAPAPNPVSPASVPSNSGSGSSGLAAPGTSYTGDLTYYQVGLGSCGITSTPDEHVVAISLDMFDPYTPGGPPPAGNPNKNTLCGKTVNISFNGQTYPATVVDRCTGCAMGDLDLSLGFFNLVTDGGESKGRFSGVSWEWAN